MTPFHLFQDLRMALRRARRTPALTAAIVLTITFGLGAAAAIAVTAGAAFLAPLPYADSDRLVHVTELRVEAGERSPTAYPTLLDWRSRATSFMGLEGYDPANLIVGSGDRARMLRGAQVTAGFFRTLGVRMTAGRDFASEEEASGGATTAIVTAGFARAQLGQGALGRTVTVNGTAHTVVGVLPESFHFALLQDADVFLPLAADAERRTDRGNRSIHVVGRLRPRVTATTARAELAAVMDGLADEYPQDLAGRTIRIVPLRDALLGPTKPVMTALLLAVVLLLVMMTANLALLMLTRYVERVPELVTRSALGATRGRLLRQLAVEAQAPALLGGVLAVLVARVALDGLLANIPESVQIGMPYLGAAAVDVRAMGLMVGTAAMLALAFGLGPALVMPGSGGRPSDLRTTASRADRRLRRGLVVAQLAVTTTLLTASGLLVTSFVNLVHRDLGYHDPSTIVTARAPLSGQRYQLPAAQQSFYESLALRTAGLPGVARVGLVDEVPGGGGGAVTYEPMDRPVSAAERPRAALRITGGDYFATMGIEIRAGRTFDGRDHADAPPVAVVSGALGRLLSADGETVGRRLRLAGTGDREWEVIGVVADVPVTAFDAEPPPVIYLSHLQRAENRLTLVVRTERDNASLARELRSIVAEQDPSVPVYAVATLERQMRESRAVLTRRLPMILCGIFAIAALLLALVALYAVCMHDVLTRRREFGIRLAVGATAGSVRRVILSSATRLGAVGIAVGMLTALFASRLLGSLMFGVTTTDWRVYIFVSAAVFGVILLASVGPMLRAGGIDPAEVMRAE